MTLSASKRARSQLLTRMAAGAITGGGAAVLIIVFLGKLHPDPGDTGAMLALAAGLCYAVIGLAVGLGALVPGAGAAFLNVEDADEIREQRRNLGPGAVACILVGLFLLILAVAPRLAVSTGPQGPALAAIGCLAAIGLIAFVTRGRSDELTRQIGFEAAALTLHVAFFVLAGWVALVRAGYVEWMSPVTLVAGLALLELVAIFAVSAKRGVMRPR